MPDIDIPRMGLPDDLALRLSMAEQHEYLVRKRGPRRRLILAAGALAALAPAAPALGFPGGGARFPGSLVVPFGRHLSFGPNPRSQMRVAWQVPHRVRHPFIRVGEKPWDLGHRIPAEIRALRSDLDGLFDGVSQYYVHAAIDGLKSGHKYYYTVGHDGYDPSRRSMFSRIDSFTTAPSRHRVPKPFTFTAFGDQGVGHASLRTDGRVAREDPVFHLHAGDLCYADSTGHGRPDDHYKPRRWDQFLAQTEPISAAVPWMVTMGNHDMEALYSPDGYGGQLARWDFPENGPRGAVGVYSFVYGNVGVVALDSNDVSFEVAANRNYTGGAQTKWLDGRLKFLRAQPDVDFIVVFFHHSAFSTTTSHASEGGVRSRWVPLFDKYHVDLVINGHNHVYERADALKNGQSTPTPTGATVRPSKDGTIYVTAGAAGRGLYSFGVPDSFAAHERELDQVPSFVWAAGHEKVPEKVTWSRVRYTGYSFVAVDVKPAQEGRTATMTLRAVTDKGAEVDRVVIARKAGPRLPHGKTAES